MKAYWIHGDRKSLALISSDACVTMDDTASIVWSRSQMAAYLRTLRQLGKHPVRVTHAEMAKAGLLSETLGDEQIGPVFDGRG